ncbi:hypothetical protein AB0G15_14500 [Streptosporangium sp. NPDC023825]|uniref:hypothetical protein n=1 Tax=Streptosporangium sp. NPDC023825 TaxID=3154909 RepID=UPI00343BC3C7
MTPLDIPRHSLDAVRRSGADVVPNRKITKDVVDGPAYWRLSRRTLAEAAVPLKNSGRRLPFRPSQKVAAGWW